jgi:hypothetical protein
MDKANETCDDLFFSEKPQQNKRSKLPPNDCVTISTLVPQDTALERNGSDETEAIVETFGLIAGIIVARKKISLSDQMTIAGNG